MSYQVLALKYRPRNFETLVGQEHVVRALSHALEQGRLHHAWLFTGTRGVGKTTLSRILAKSLNCQGPDGQGGVTASPCGQCEACRAIDAGRFVDYIEMDAASNRGVDEMAQLLEQAVYAPSNARFKVYMIDEVHMLTNHAFNAMLKTLEEPPPHVKFILATTDPQKIPVTVLSRCLQFNLKQMPPGQVVAHLEDILGREGIAFEPAALRLLAQGAQGSMRDALSLTDQAIAYAAGPITLEAVQGMLGTLDQSYLLRLLDALAAKDGPALLAIADELASRSLSYSAALQDLGVLLHRIALAQLVPEALADDLPERAEILRLAQAFDPEEVQLFYQIATHGRHELALAPDEYAGFSMTLLRMLAFRPEMEAGRGPTASLPTGQAAAATRDTVPPVDKAQPPSARPASAAPPASSAASAAPDANGGTERAAGERSARPNPALAALEAARAGRGGRRQGTVAPPPPARMERAPVPTSAEAPAPASAPAASSAYSPPWEEDPPWPEEDYPSADAGTAQKKSDPPEAVALNRAAAPASAPYEAEERIGSRQPGQAFTVLASESPKAGAGMQPSSPADAPAVAQNPAPIWTPVAALGWDGNWPQLAAALPLRGVVQQLAQQSELLDCNQEGQAFTFLLQVPLNTLCSAGSIDKLAACLSERFGQAIRVETRIGPVRHTAHAVALAEQAQRQREAERSMQEDPFVQTLMRELGATIVPGSIRPL